MVTSTVSAGTAFVSTHISAGTSYVVKGSGTLDVVNGGVVFRPDHGERLPGDGECQLRRHCIGATHHQ